MCVIKLENDQLVERHDTHCTNFFFLSSISTGSGCEAVRPLNLRDRGQ
jgi:hypothetical protein